MLTRMVIPLLPNRSSPRDPLNFPKWQKYIIIIILALFSTFSIGGVASFSALLGTFFPIYLAPPGMPLSIRIVQALG